MSEADLTYNIQNILFYFVYPRIEVGNKGIVRKPRQSHVHMSKPCVDNVYGTYA